MTDALANTWQKQFPLDYGKVRLWGSVAFVIGSALTGKLVTMFDYRVILALLTLGVASMLLGFLIRPTIQPQGASRQQGEHRLVCVVGAGSPELALSGLRLFIAGGTCGLLRF